MVADGAVIFKAINLTYQYLHLQPHQVSREKKHLLTLSCFCVHLKKRWRQQAESMTKTAFGSAPHWGKDRSLSGLSHTPSPLINSRSMYRSRPRPLGLFRERRAARGDHQVLGPREEGPRRPPDRPQARGRRWCYPPPSSPFCPNLDCVDRPSPTHHRIFFRNHTVNGALFSHLLDFVPSALI